MKKIVRILIVATVLFIAVISCFNILFTKMSQRRNIDINTVANRINHIITENYVNSDETPDKIITQNQELWKDTYGEKAPISILFIPINSDSNSRFFKAANERCALCSLYNKNGDLVGLIEYQFSDTPSIILRLCVNAVLCICFILVVIFISGTYIKIIMPFRKLSEYPERLAKLKDIQKLPESKNRYFGKYIWGMNMLSDVLASNSRRIHILEGERQKLVTSIAHGVKTPVANIRLYTDAVRTGLYSNSPMTSDIADKIDKNAEKIQLLAEELMSASYASFDGYDIDICSFYLDELADLLKNEYTDRMKLLHIPFKVECIGKPLMKSDKYALYRAISQLLENALKYGNGNGITVKLMKQDDSFSISVRNKGELLPESELPYVFRSYWRGSNASTKEGSGIGLYAVHEITKALGGSVYARRIEETSEMEFIIFFE